MAIMAISIFPDSDCDVYMEQSEGFAADDPRQMVCLLKKSTY